MDKNITIIITVNSNLELIQETLLKLKKIEFIDELYVISKSDPIKDIKDLINKNIFVSNPKIELKNFSNIVEGINICLSKSNSSYSLILNEGDSLDNLVLSRLINIFKEDKFTKIIYTNSILTNKKDKWINIFKNGKWEYCKRTEILNDIMNNNYYLLDSHYDEIGKDLLNNVQNMQYSKFKDEFTNGKLAKNTRDDIDLVIINADKK